MYNRKRMLEQRPIDRIRALPGCGHVRLDDLGCHDKAALSRLASTVVALHGRFDNRFDDGNLAKDPYRDTDQRVRSTPLGPSTRWRGREDSRGFPAADNSGDEGKSLEYRQWLSDETKRLDIEDKLEGNRDEYDYAFTVRIPVPEGQDPAEFAERSFPGKKCDIEMNSILVTCGDEGEARNIANQVRGLVERKKLDKQKEK